MATRPKQSEQDVIADARQVLARVARYRAAFTAADKGRKRKLLEPALLTRLKKNVAAASRAVGAQASRANAVHQATGKEVRARALLFDAVTSIRDDVKLAWDGDASKRGVARAFGVGRRLNLKSTPSLLAAASAIDAAYADSNNAKAASAAGVKPARIKQLARLASTLAAADDAQSAGIAGRRSATANKNALLRSIRADVAHIRQAAARVFKGQKAVLKEFRPTTPRVKPKPRRRAVAAPPAPKPSPKPAVTNGVNATSSAAS
jgi:hypothetical protein